MNGGTVIVIRFILSILGTIALVMALLFPFVVLPLLLSCLPGRAPAGAEGPRRTVFHHIKCCVQKRE